MYNGFSILIPTWNNLDYLKLCVRSIRQHSAYNHQIIIHVNDGSDGTLEWVKAEGLDYTHSEENIGVCLAMNSMRRLVKTEYIYFINDDMYVLPNWDVVLMEEIKSRPDNMYYLSGTMIQPHDKDDVGLCINYGDSIQTFEEERLLKEYMNTPYAKLLMVGVTHLKGLGNSRVYHFETKTTGRIKKNDGSTQFLLKWGISNSTMRKHITRQGQDWSLHDTPINKVEIAKKKRFVRIKALWYIMKKGFGIAKDLGEV